MLIGFVKSSITEGIDAKPELRQSVTLIVPDQPPCQRSRFLPISFSGLHQEGALNNPDVIRRSEERSAIKLHCVRGIISTTCNTSSKIATEVCFEFRTGMLSAD